VPLRRLLQQALLRRQPRGDQIRRRPGGKVGVTEWAYGVTVTPWFEQGLYLPLYSADKNLGAKIDGFKIRELFTVPDAANRRFVFGVGFGLTNPSDKLTLKLLVSRDLNVGHNGRSQKRQR